MLFAVPPIRACGPENPARRRHVEVVAAEVDRGHAGRRATSMRSSTTRQTGSPSRARRMAPAASIKARVVHGRFSRNWIASAPPAAASRASST